VKHFIACNVWSHKLDFLYSYSVSLAVLKGSVDASLHHCVYSELKAAAKVNQLGEVEFSPGSVFAWNGCTSDRVGLNMKQTLGVRGDSIE
jgi:hypothetical protein